MSVFLSDRVSVQVLRTVILTVLTTKDYKELYFGRCPYIVILINYFSPGFLPSFPLLYGLYIIIIIVFTYLVNY